MSLCLCLALLILGDRAEKKKGEVLKSFALPSARADWLACGEKASVLRRSKVSTDEGGGERHDYDSLHLFLVVGERGLEVHTVIIACVAHYETMTRRASSQIRICLHG